MLSRGRSRSRSLWGVTSYYDPTLIYLDVLS